MALTRTPLGANSNASDLVSLSWAALATPYARKPSAGTLLRIEEMLMTAPCKRYMKEPAQLCFNKLCFVFCVPLTIGKLQDI